MSCPMKKMLCSHKHMFKGFRPSNCTGAWIVIEQMLKRQLLTTSFMRICRGAFGERIFDCSCHTNTKDNIFDWQRITDSVNHLYSD